MKTLVGCISVLVAGGLLIAPSASPATDTPRPVAHACDITVYKLGSLQLPYAGDGGVEYNLVTHSWIITVKAPEGFTSSNVGWEFPAAGRIPAAIIPRDGEDAWSISGPMDIQVVDKVLTVLVWTTEGVHELHFNYAPELNWQSGKTFVQNELGRLEIEVDEEAIPQAIAADAECPGGKCKCDGKCEACCSTGFHPHCDCSGAGSCNCLENKPKKEVAIETMDYTEVYAL